MPRKIKFVIKDKNTIVLKEDAKANDFIDISAISQIDKDAISEFLADAENLAQQKAQQIYEQKIKDEQYNWDKLCSKKDAEIKQLRLENISLIDNKKIEIDAAKDKIRADLLEQQNKSNDKYQKEINLLTKEKNDQVAKNTILSQEILQWKKDYKTLQNTKAMQLPSTKSWGELLEKYVYETFESAQQNGAFTLAHFYKDNLPIKDPDELKATKGDFIFRDYDDNNNEILSIEIEVKTEQLNTTHKTRNKDHYETLHKNRVKKHCEYALLISELEKDNSNFDGIYKVQEYEKMYVVRPASFLSFINILKDNLRKNKELIAEINNYKNTSYDIETFKKNLRNFQDDVEKTTSHGIKTFDATIKYIDNTIDNLQKAKDNLLKTGKRMLTAQKKVSDVNYKKLISGCKKDPFGQ